VLVEILFDKKTGPSSADLHRFLQTIKTGTGPFYVHCVGGTHRAGVLGVAYRMHILNWPYEKAVLEFGQLGGDLKADHSLLEPVKAFKP
jgi:protein tyrosine/serine phosphatase